MDGKEDEVLQGNTHITHTDEKEQTYVQAEESEIRARRGDKEMRKEKPIIKIVLHSN